MKEIQVIDQVVKDHLENNVAFTIICSKPKRGDYTKAIINPYHKGDVLQIKIVLRTETQDHTTSIAPEFLSSWLAEHLKDYFSNLDFQGEQTLSIRQSKKGKVSLIKHKSNSSNTNKIQQHNKQKNYLIPENAPFLKELGLASSNSRIHASAYDKYRQINKFIEIVASIVAPKEELKIVDMGSGKGYLTFALYHYLKEKYPNINLSMMGFELRQDLVEKCNAAAQKCGFFGLRFEKADIQSAEVGKIDLLIALHACDIATDMAIAKALEGEASYMILAPCCHKQIRKAMTSSNPILKHGIYLERTAEMVTDTIRALLIESRGYKTKIFEFISKDHTAKNTMITAVKDNVNMEAIKTVDALKSEYGISSHYLEEILTN